MKQIVVGLIIVAVVAVLGWWLLQSSVKTDSLPTTNVTSEENDEEITTMLETNSQTETMEYIIKVENEVAAYRTILEEARMQNDANGLNEAKAEIYVQQLSILLQSINQEILKAPTDQLEGEYRTSWLAELADIKTVSLLNAGTLNLLDDLIAENDSVKSFLTNDLIETISNLEIHTAQAVEGYEAISAEDFRIILYEQGTAGDVIIEELE